MPLILVSEEDDNKSSSALVMHEPTAFIFTLNDEGDLGLYVYGDGQFTKNDEAPLGGEIGL